MLKIEKVISEDGSTQAKDPPNGCRVACISGEFYALEPEDVIDALLAPK